VSVRLLGIERPGAFGFWEWKDWERSALGNGKTGSVRLLGMDLDWDRSVFSDDEVLFFVVCLLFVFGGIWVGFIIIWVVEIQIKKNLDLLG